MRGKGLCGESGECVDRITPAYAGKSRQCTGFRQCTGDHPRLCGEKFLQIRSFPQQLGSPPPMRGKVADKSDIVRKHGITPAYAGKSVGNLTDLLWIWDHPRLCGEKRENQSNNKS